jgi:hypothetical protein
VKQRCQTPVFQPWELTWTAAPASSPVPMQPRCAYCDRALHQRIYDDLSWSWCDPGAGLPHVCEGRAQAVARGEVLIRFTAADWEESQRGLRLPEPRSERADAIRDLLMFGWWGAVVWLGAVTVFMLVWAIGLVLLG